MPTSEKRAYLTSGDLAKLLLMDRSGVASAADAGRLGDVERTPGGHRRFKPASVVAALRASGATVPEALEEMVGETCPANAKDRIASVALDESERILAPVPGIRLTPMRDATIDRGVNLAENAATIFAAIASDETARLLRRAERRERGVVPPSLEAHDQEQKEARGFTLSDRCALKKLEALAVAQNELRALTASKADQTPISEAMAQKVEASGAAQVSPCRAGGIGCSWEPWQEAMGCRTPDEARARAEHAKLELRAARETCAEYLRRAERATTERDEARNEIERLRRQIDELRAEGREAPR